ncbi:nephrin-like [Homarus americanus]|uniref:nephrin-like n=1 Tax=Homarus americanus TaxID=6706 RepID=UPI001C453204|nr:nephrin-like [Homarus americanus]
MAFIDLTMASGGPFAVLASHQNSSLIFDVRSGPANHWKNPSHLGSRANFHPTTASLTLQHVQADDQGTYRCRVDFRINPTLTFTTNLTVIVPPSRLGVYTELGVEARNIVGPFTEGDILRLACRVMGGSPPPTVTWWEGPVLLDMTHEVETLDQVTNTLVVPSLTRRDLHRSVTCQAANSNLTAPLSTTVSLDMKFPPLWVRLLSSRDPLSAGRTYEVVCQSAGARPPAVIEWHLAPGLPLALLRISQLSIVGMIIAQVLINKILPEAEEFLAESQSSITELQYNDDLTIVAYTERDLQLTMNTYANVDAHLGLDMNLSHEGNVTKSELLLTPEVDDGGKVLSCLAESPALTLHPLVDEWLLEVCYVPVATLHPGRSLNLSNIEERDDVYFECSIKANPWVYKIVWLHEGTELQHNVTAGVIISNQSLVLQRVDRTASGNYFCVASNIEGDGQSNPILLRVKYAPVCRNPQMTYHGAARYEQVNIPCHLDAHPKPVSFRWTFNNSGESVDIPQEHIHVKPSESTVSYTPNTELDYGTLLCWGTNAVGLQRRPCVFHVFPAGKPDPLHNCSVYNLSVTVVNVRCMAGFDGGLPQTFILELYHPRTNTLLANATNSVPTFSVPDLPVGVTMRGIVYSINAKGGSDKLSLQVYTLKDVAERRTAAVKPSPTHGKSSAHFSLTPVIGLVLGAVGGFLIIVIVICIIVRVRYSRRSVCVGQCERANVQDIAVGQNDPSSAACHPKMAPTSLQDSVPPPPATSRDFDEKNPDVIPQSEADSCVVEGVNTISSASLPTSYATLPRSQHICTLANYQQQQQPCGAGDVQYAELMLGSATPSPQHHDHKRGPQDSQRTVTTIPQHHEPQRVIYTTLDHKRRHSHYPPPHQHLAYPQPVSTTNTTPTHALHIQSTPTHSGGHPKGTQHPPWIPSTASIGRRHSLRPDSHIRDPETVVSMIPNQKESSV